MQREPGDLNKSEIDEKDLQEMEERRIVQLEEAGIDEDHVLTRAHKNFNAWQSYFGENITTGKADLDFITRNQWSAHEHAEFTRLQKPPMTFNKLYDPIRKVLGEQRKNKPDLIVRSLNGKVDQEQLDLRGDLVRTISYQSQNDLVYQTAFKSALLMGYGAFQIGIDYESPRSFNKIIKYIEIPDATRCSWDPLATKPHKGDGNFCGRSYTISREEFFATYPYITNPVSFVDPYMLVDYHWQTRDTICIGDQYVKEWYSLSIVQLSNGMSVTEEEWEAAQKSMKKQQDIVEGSIVAEIIKDGMPHMIGKRQTQDFRIMHYRMLRNCIIDFEEFPCRYLPIPFVDGDSYYIDGKQYTKSFMHESKDAQRCVNYFNSEIAAEIKNRRREQWLGTPENITGYEQIWRNPEVQVGMLPARPDPKTGQMPMKQAPWEISQALMVNAQKSSQDIKEISGFSEQEVIGSRDMSGIARRERKLEGGLAAYIFFDNLNEAIAQGGRIVNDLLPYIIGKDERHMTIAKPDGKTSSVIFNHMQKDGNVKNVLDEGDFDVEIDAGPSFAVQKEIALEMFQQAITANPEVFPLIADLWAKNMDIQFMPQIVERFKTLVPPAILAKEDGKPAPKPQPNPQQMMMQQQMMQQQKEMQDRTTELHQKQQQIDIEKERVKNDAIEMLGHLQIDRDKNDIDKQRLVNDLTKLITDSHTKRKERDLDVHKSYLDHTAKLSNILNSSHKE